MAWFHGEINEAQPVQTAHLFLRRSCFCRPDEMRPLTPVDYKWEPETTQKNNIIHFRSYRLHTKSKQVLMKNDMSTCKPSEYTQKDNYEKMLTAFWSFVPLFPKHPFGACG